MRATYILALAMISLLSVTGLAAAHMGNGLFQGEDFAAMQEERDAMQAAIESNDFGEWKSLMEERIEQMRAEITEENFQEMVNRHQEREEFRSAMDEARESGDYSEVQSLREEYGMGFGKENGRGMHRAKYSE